MVTNRRVISLGFSAHRIQEGRHLCFLFNDEGERLDVIDRFLASGLQQREKVICLVDRMGPKAFVEQLRTYGVAPTETGLVVAEASAAYCPSGHFNADDVLLFVGKFYEAARVAGYEGARGTGEMGWSLEGGCVDMTELMSYEARLNDVLDVSPITLCCQYDVRRFDGQSLLDILSVHPIAIVHGQVVQNPYYVDPAVFLAKLNHRRATHV